MTRQFAPSPSANARIVRLAPVFGHSHLFQALAKGAKGPAHDECRGHAGKRFRIQAPLALGTPEQTLLLALLDVAAEQHRHNPRQCLLEADDGGEVARNLWAALYPAGAAPRAQAAPTLMLRTSWAELQRRCGGSNLGGTVLAARRRGLTRLAEVLVSETAHAGTPGHTCRLLGFWVDGDACVHVALNHWLAAALQEPGYAQVSLCERLQLRSQAAMLTHVFLSSSLSPGNTITIKYETLVQRLWADAEHDVAPSTHRRRLSDAQSALKAIASLPGWRITLEPSKAKVTRLRPITAFASASRRHSAHRFGKRLPTTPGSADDVSQARLFDAPDMSYARQPLLQALSSEESPVEI